VIGWRALSSPASEPDAARLFGFGASRTSRSRSRSTSAARSTRSRAARRAAPRLEIGRAWAGGADDDPGCRLDAAVTVRPGGELVPAALARLRPGGTVAINAIHMSPIPVDAVRARLRRARRPQRQNATRTDALELLDLGRRDPDPREVAEYALEDANAGAARRRAGNVRGAAVLRVG
jgi:propanol-preferring alcohol dehydrogenase